MRIQITLLLLLIQYNINAQETMKDSLPYAKIPEPAEEYTAETIVSRMIDGLGFRYYWATEGLKEEDLNYKPSKESRSILETVDHILGLTTTIVNSAKKQPTVSSKKAKEMSFTEKRQLTLESLKIASGLFRNSKDISEHKIVFERDNGKSEFPFWNQINGPIEDAVWHAGQIVVLRRSAGNPINPKVNFFLGNLRE